MSFKIKDPKLSVWEYARHVFGRAPSRSILAWPPDVFCFAAALLWRSGAYTEVVSRNPPYLGWRRDQREKALQELANEWQLAIVRGKSVPTTLEEWWRNVSQAKKVQLSDIRNRRELLASIINLLAVADNACAGAGISDPNPDEFSTDLELRLLLSKGQTLCESVDPSKFVVLPKMHTPQTGLTIRSFSHNLGLIQVGEMIPEWHPVSTESYPDRKGKRGAQHVLNLLVLPWPNDFWPSQFRDSVKVNVTDEVPRGAYGLFTVASSGLSPAQDIRRLIKKAEERVGPVDGVIMPELALTPNMLNSVRKSVFTGRRFLVTGVGLPAKGPKKPGQNYLLFEYEFPGREFTVSHKQFKHHRWKIDGSQVVQYGIGTSLNPNTNWWEHIELGDRRLTFLNLKPWLTLAPLICEDLSRPDPVGDLVRAVGPNLVIALLMDGPQLSSRWPGRYAATLADDPGCSVLSVTSHGMSQLSKGQFGPDRCDVVALWKDRSGPAKELVLPRGAEALVLVLTVRYDEEWTADGRGDQEKSGYPMLSGVHPI